MAKGVVGMFERTGSSQKLQTEDSAIKKSMKAVMKLGKKNAPKMPKVNRHE
jgi:hypothetical protein